jgi:hypothetical protein
VHLKPILRYNVKTWALKRRNKRHAQAMDMKFLRNIKEKQKRIDRHEILRKKESSDFVNRVRR